MKQKAHVSPFARVGGVLLLVASLVFPCNAFAQRDPGTDNIIIDNNLRLGFRYQKTIDMTHAKDRSTLPDASFTYTLRVLDKEDKDARLGIDTKYTLDGDLTYVIKAGELPQKASSMPFSHVTFRSKDHYWPELKNLILENKPKEALNFIINNAWGEMRSSDHVQTVVSRLPSDDERDEWEKEGGTYVQWPTNISPWKISPEIEDPEQYLTPEGYYKPETPANYEMGGQLLRNFTWPMNYVETMNLPGNPVVTYSAYAIRAPYIANKSTDAEGKLTSVSKPLFSPEEYEHLIQTIMTNHPDTTNDYKPSEQIIRRYVLTEDTPDAAFAKNTNRLIVDYVPSVPQGALFIFASNEQADAFYKKAFTPDAWYVDINAEIQQLPAVGFTNSYVLPEKPDTPKDPEKPETPKDPEKPETPKDPEKPVTPDTPKDPEKPDTPKDPKTPDQPLKKKETPKTPSHLPKTGDMSSLVLLGGVGASVCALTCAIALRRRQRS
ncbi:LPXTG cell wall anchor domain-containing protein [Collinsella sp. AGMB00827]|uniref:LPXTG cell wall anchor domain-containing protein n=1 Tax=Collinsella ureilytica TaxID=2869515 RepID=A0ABS7MM79_9ACTN|nr:LPXTG cell wall anchor domain-containing protein [Collinsella urealyticum]MBY4798392.1 LPXTG cell wall anchor domain-containing protein [Collinsella urealyticum]